MLQARVGHDAVRSAGLRDGRGALCLGYATGGGREAAAGINHLPMESIGGFTERFLTHFGTG